MSAKDTGETLLAEMEKTIPQKVAICTAHMLLREGSVVLDAGCADGLATTYFALKHPHVRVIGVDKNSDYIDRAAEKFGDIPNVEFICADMSTLDLRELKVDVALNLSFTHEPFSFTGYRHQTVEEIFAAELAGLEDNGVIITRDFNLPDQPEELVYLALPDHTHEFAGGKDLENMSMPELLRLYAQEANRFDNGDPDHHIKGFFLEDHTQAFKGAGQTVPQGWRVFYLAHHNAWEFIWRMHYRTRFYDEAAEKYAFWTAAQHREMPEKLGARVLYTAPHENPWLLENRYRPNAMLFDRDLKPLPLPPSNFISVLQKIESGDSIRLREHRPSQTPPGYLQAQSFRSTASGEIYDMIARPGGDVADILPSYTDADGELMILAKSGYPRPLTNIVPRQMTPNIDGKNWSGHVMEPLAVAHTNGAIGDTVMQTLLERAGFREDEVTVGEPALSYYPAPAELNERVFSVPVEVKSPPVQARPLRGGYSGFSTDGTMRAYNAKGLIDAAGVGMLAEARLEVLVYDALRQHGLAPKDWLGQSFTPAVTTGIPRASLSDLQARAADHAVFKPTDQRSHWLDIVRSEFHEIALHDGSEKAIARKELEFVVPNPVNAHNTSTNSVTLTCLTRDAGTNEVMLGLQKISPTRSQFPAVQLGEGHSGHIAIPGLRLPNYVDHIQNVPGWIADTIGDVDPQAILRLGEGYFPSLGVLPNRVFPFVITEPGETIRQRCDFVPLREVFATISTIKDLHTMVAVMRSVHALDLWESYSASKPAYGPAPVPKAT